MTGDVLTRWADNVELSTQAWDDARQQVFQRLGVPTDIGIRLQMFAVGHQVFEPGGFHNWVRLLDDAVRRVRREDDLPQTVLTIAREMYETIQATSDVSLKSPFDQADENPADYIPDPCSDFGYSRVETGHVAHLASRIIGQFSGNVDLNGVAEARAQHDPTQSEAPASETTVLVRRRNEQNLEDIAAITVEHGQDFFGETWAESTLMFNALRRAAVKPAFVVQDVAFDAEGNSWGGGESPPPAGPLSFMSTDHKDRVNFFTISDPQDVFEGCWGNLREMMQNFDSDDCMNQYYAPVAWNLVLGV